MGGGREKGEAGEGQKRQDEEREEARSDSGIQSTHKKREKLTLSGLWMMNNGI